MSNTDELEQKIADLQNQINDLRAFASKGVYSNDRVFDTNVSLKSEINKTLSEDENDHFGVIKEGMYLGDKYFDDAPFKVTMQGAVTAVSGTFIGGTIYDTLTMGSASLDGTIQSYGWNGTVNGFQIKGGVTPVVTLIGGTITGGIIQTGLSGDYIKLDGSANTLTVYQNDNERVVLGEGVITFLTPTGVGSGEIYGLGTGTLGFNVGGSGDYQMNETELSPLSAAHDLGGATPWHYLYADDIYITGIGTSLTDWMSMIMDLIAALTP